MIPIYIDVSDEVTTVIERIKNSKESHLALVVPKGAILIQSIVNLKLIKKSADTAGTEVVLVTTDKIGRNLATQIGIPSFSKFDPQKMTMEDEDGSSEANIIAGVKIHRYYEEKEDNPEDVEQEIDPIIIPKEILKDRSNPDNATPENSEDKEANSISQEVNNALPDPEKAELKKKQINQDIEMPVKKRVIETEVIKEVVHEKTAEKKPDNDNTKINLNNLESALPTAEKDEKEQNNSDKSQKKESIKPTTKNHKPAKSFWPATIAYVVIIIIIGALGAGYYFLPETDITVSIAGTAWNKDFTITSIQPKIISKETSKEYTAKTTGKKEVGTAAQGTATLYNYDSTSSQTLPANSRITASGAVFITQAAIIVPGYTQQVGQPRVPGSATIAIVAEKAGTEGNLDNTTASDITSTNLNLSAKISASGGTSKQIAIVSSDDIKNARLELEKQLQADLTTQIENELKDKNYLANNTKDQFVVSDFNSPAINTESDNITVSAKATLKRLAIDQTEVQAFVDQEAAKENTANTTVAVQKLQSTLENIDTANNTLTINTNANGITSYKVNNIDEISQAIAGKTSQQAKDIIKDKLTSYNVQEIRIEQKTIGSYLRIPISKHFVKIQVQDVAQ